MRKMMWSRGSGIRALLAGAALAAVAAAPAVADEVEAPPIPVPAEEAEEAKPEAPDPSSWDAQRRIPAMSPFVDGTGFWGPSLKPGYD